jgi:hypothetical protein
MKKLIVLFVLATILFSCGNNEAEKKSLIGEWKEIAGNKNFKDYTIILNEDGSADYSFMLDDISKTKRTGKWDIDDNHISITEKKILTFYKGYKLSNDTLIIGIGGANADIFKMKKVK